MKPKFGTVQLHAYMFNIVLLRSFSFHTGVIDPNSRCPFRNDSFVTMVSFSRLAKLSSLPKAGNMPKCLQQSSTSKNELWTWCEDVVGTESWSSKVRMLVFPFSKWTLEM